QDGHGGHDQRDVEIKASSPPQIGDDLVLRRTLDFDEPAHVLHDSARKKTSTSGGIRFPSITGAERRESPSSLVLTVASPRGLLGENTGNISSTSRQKQGTSPTTRLKGTVMEKSAAETVARNLLVQHGCSEENSLDAKTEARPGYEEHNYPIDEDSFLQFCDEQQKNSPSVSRLAASCTTTTTRTQRFLSSASVSTSASSSLNAALSSSQSYAPPTARTTGIPSLVSSSSLFPENASEDHPRATQNSLPRSSHLLLLEDEEDGVQASADNTGNLRQKEKDALEAGNMNSTISASALRTSVASSSPPTSHPQSSPPTSHPQRSPPTPSSSRSVTALEPASCLGHGRHNEHRASATRRQAALSPAIRQDTTHLSRAAKNKKAENMTSSVITKAPYSRSQGKDDTGAPAEQRREEKTRAPAFVFGCQKRQLQEAHGRLTRADNSSQQVMDATRGALAEAKTLA
ncbi:unnamed protein product, partial [Amoebophrya sp. A25]